MIDKNSAFCEWHDLLLWIAASNAPSAPEWTAYTELAVKLGTRLKARGKPLSVLVVSDGGAPTAGQRSSFLAATEGISVRTAVVSSSAFARGVVTVFSWFKMDTRCFAPRDVEASFDFLHLAPEERAGLWSAMEMLQSQLAKTPVKAIAQATPHLRSTPHGEAAASRESEASRR